MSRRIIILHEEIEQILLRLDRIEEAVRIRQKQPEDTFFDNQEFIQIMNVSKRTAQSWRETGLIAYSQVGSKIYYSLADIHSMLNNHYKPSKTAPWHKQPSTSSSIAMASHKSNGLP